SRHETKKRSNPTRAIGAKQCGAQHDRCHRLEKVRRIPRNRRVLRAIAARATHAVAVSVRTKHRPVSATLPAQQGPARSQRYATGRSLEALTPDTHASSGSSLTVRANSGTNRTGPQSTVLVSS